MAYQFTQTGAELQDLIDRIYQIAEEYDPGTSYVIGDYCSYGGKVYRCTAETTGTFDPSKWTDSVIVMDAVKSLKGRMDTAEGDIDAAQEDISALKSRATRVDLTVTAGANVTLGANKACIIDGFIYLSIKGKANAAISNAVVATISGDKNFVSPTTIPVGIGAEWNITSAGYGFLSGKTITATVASGSWFHIVATVPYA